MSSMIAYIFAGLLGVTNMILRGVYGDLLVERFDITKVLRSILLGIIRSVLVFLTNPMLPLFVVALVVISLERATTELYKALIRHEDQKKYQIPSDLNIKLSHTWKVLIGIALIMALGAFVYYAEISISKIYLTGIMGILIALGGMSKDAPFEGFDIVKFFRSPIVAGCIGILLVVLFPAIEGKLFLLAVAGGERIVSERYKKILHGRIPGKFRKIPHDKIWEKKRKRLLPFYILNIATLIFLITF